MTDSSYISMINKVLPIDSRLDDGMDLGSEQGEPMALFSAWLLTGQDELQLRITVGTSIGLNQHIYLSDHCLTRDPLTEF
jgi:hypothetical protein